MILALRHGLFAWGAGHAWLASTGLFLGGCVVVWRQLRRHYPHPSFGACNAVTLIRGALVCTLVAPLTDTDMAADPWVMPGIALVALVLDGVDGWLARRSGLVSAFGARFDVEIDAALALVLALHGLARGVAGPEVLLLALPRYGFIAAAWAWPWLGAPLPPRFRRKLICVVQLAVLIALLVPTLPPVAAPILLGWGTAALLASFAIDILWLWARR